MKYLVNQSKELNKRRILRRNQTYAEKLLWNHLRNKQLGYKFRRQVSIGSYVVDFYCPKVKLAIEIDGNSHYEPKAITYDKIRTEWINYLGIRIIRFTNQEVYDNADDIVSIIKNSLEEG